MPIPIISPYCGGLAYEFGRLHVLKLSYYKNRFQKGTFLPFNSGLELFGIGIFISIISRSIKIISNLNLNIKLYVPTQTSAHREISMGQVPGIDDPRHEKFTQQVKLEPFKRAMEEIKPDLWITNLRKGQTEFRNNIDILTETDKGLLKVSPFYYWADLDLEAYMNEHSLENEFDYFDPTKVDEKRECGLHNQGNKA